MLNQKKLNNHPLKNEWVRNEDLIIPESMAQGFGFIGMLEKQAHSGLRNFFLACLWSQKTSQTWLLLNPRSLERLLTESRDTGRIALLFILIGIRG